MVSGEHDRLPDRSLVAFGVAQEAERASGRCLEPSRKRQIRRRPRVPDPSEPGREINAAELSLRMRAQQRPVRSSTSRKLLTASAIREGGAPRREQGLRAPSIERGGRDHGRPGHRSASLPRSGLRGCPRRESAEPMGARAVLVSTASRTMVRISRALACLASTTMGVRSLLVMLHDAPFCTRTQDGLGSGSRNRRTSSRTTRPFGPRLTTRVSNCSRTSPSESAMK